MNKLRGDGERLYELTSVAMGGLLASGDERHPDETAAEALKYAQSTLKIVKEAQRIFGASIKNLKASGNS